MEHLGDITKLSGYELPSVDVVKRRKISMKLVIPGPLPGLNDIIDADRTNRHKGANLKRSAQNIVILCAKKQLRGFRPKVPIRMEYTWYERNRKRDKDNISSGGRKIIQDGLVKAGVLKNDGWEDIEGFSDRFAIDKENPRVEIEIEEVSV